MSLNYSLCLVIFYHFICTILAFSQKDNDYLSPKAARELYCVYQTLGKDYNITTLQQLQSEEEDGNESMSLEALNASIIDYWKERKFIRYKIDDKTELIERWAFTTYAAEHKSTTTGQAMEFCSRDQVEGLGIIFAQSVSRAFECVFRKILQSCTDHI